MKSPFSNPVSLATLATLELGAAVMALTMTLTSLPAQAADVGVSVQISQPGVYGRIDIGRFPQPLLVLQQPVIISPPVVAYAEPVYLWVPPGHRRNWRRHCGHYNACGVPVYFVDNGWYGEHVRPHAEDRDDDRGEKHKGKYKDKDKGKDKDKYKYKD